ncbi:RelA/SpoT domain-containing protein [Candidatus Woesearchaeota archaeon]|nr:RelA/SpoT domain-containing protein [Candidatus Woesearchaeota archaeon]
MAWTKPKYGKAKIDRAGHILVSEDSTEEEKEEAMSILNNWRSSHGYPMNTFQARLRQVSKKVDENYLVVQRLKRAPSIIKKLKRDQTKTMSLSQMQDIAGCRAVLSDVDKVNELVGIYRKSRGLKHKKIREKDYIKNPKKDGYRSMHLIYRYKSDKINTYDGLLIEIQVRSKIQHAWATAIEIVDLFTKQAIKSNEGDEEWKEFFRLLSSAFAKIEKQKEVENTPTNNANLFSAIKEKVDKLKIFSKMRSWTQALKVIEPKLKEWKFFLLELDVSDETKPNLSIRGYPEEGETIATEHYLEAEKLQSDSKDKDVVLVGADSVEELKKAYLNYFANSREFLEYLQFYLEKRGEV